MRALGLRMRGVGLCGTFGECDVGEGGGHGDVKNKGYGKAPV